MIDQTPGPGRGIDPLVRLCRTYDPLLGPDAAPLSGAQTAELSGLARIYDLDAERDPATVWRELRRVLVSQAAADTVAAPAEPLTILVAEDDAEAAADLVQGLIEAGHRVVGPFQEAETAILSAGLHTLDLALLDINLAGEDTGVDLARRLERTWGVPTVFLSGDVAQAARHAGDTSALVLKPYSMRQVLNAVAFAARDDAQPSFAPTI